MNKNWLYRVLAIALIAMLALPVFAMAEEVLTDETEAVEEVVEEIETALTGEDEEGVDDVDSNLVSTDVWVELTNETVDFDEIDKAYDRFVIGVDTTYLEESGDVKSIRFKSNKPKVASVKKSGDKGIVTLKKAGEDVKITVSAKFRPDGHKSWNSVYSYVEFDVTNKYAIDGVKIYLGTVDDYDEDDLLKNGTSKSKDIGAGLSIEEGVIDAEASDLLIPVAINGDGDAILDYIAVASENASNDLEDLYLGGWKWKWSNAKVAFFLPGDPDAEAGEEGYNGVTKKEQKSGKWFPIRAYYDMEDEDWVEEQGDGGLVPVFYKPGKSTLTFTSYTDSKKKANIKLTVNDKKYSRSYSKKDKVDDKFYVAIGGIEYKSLDEAEVTVWAFNGTEAKYKGGKFDVTIKTSGEDSTELFKGNKKFADVKAGEVKKMTIKFKNSRDKVFALDEDDDVEVLDSTINLKLYDYTIEADDFYGMMEPVDPIIKQD